MPYQSAVDVLHDRRHSLTDDQYARESIVYFVHLPELGISFGAYTWVGGSGGAGAAASFYRAGAKTLNEGVDGVPVADATDFDEWVVGPLALRHGEPHRRASVTWSGADFTFEFAFEATHEPFGYADAPGGCPPFVADDRIEQSGRVTGVFRIDGREHAFEAQGHRDHSWGVRDWKMIQQYKWFEGQAGDTRVHAFEITARGERLTRGYVHRDGVLSSIRSAEFTTTLDDRCFATAVSIVITDDDGRETVVQGTEQSRVELPVSPDATLVDTVLELEIDGVGGGGYLDLSWPPAYLAHMRETTYAVGAATRSR